ncbi:MAG: molybdopterin-dependent oxidoreductase [Bacteroidota bacterium]|nr:molybdopterin-dependent oxidoreductase [Bacteroidota bacterium]
MEPSSKSKTFKTTCSYCGVGCGIEVTKESNNKISLKGDKDNPANKGMLCSKGMNLHYTVMDHSDRIFYPEMRWNRNQQRQRVSWDQALDRTVAVFKTFIEKYGPDSVGFYVSGQCLTEEYYIINKLIKGFIGSNNIDTNSRLCMSSAVVGYKLSLGEDSVPVCYEDIELADTFFVAGANPAWCHPIIWRRVEAHKKANPDVKIIVVDPRKTQTAAMADLHLQINPGTDIVLFHAIGRLLIEKEAIDLEFINNHTDGFEIYKETVFKRTLKESASICGIKAEDIQWAATYISRSQGFLTMWTMGLNQSVIGVNKNLSLINLNLITGHIGKPGSGPFSLTGQPNAMGGREVGGLANLLPAHRDLSKPEHRTEVEQFWNSPVKIAPKPGLTATEMFDALADGRMKAIWIVCTNPLVSLPDVRKAEEALKNAKFVVVQDSSWLSDTTKFADVILPAASWAEKEGTMTNSERRISYLNKIVDAPGEALPDTEIIQKFAIKMGFGDAFGYSGSAQVFDEYAKITKGTNIDISGLSYHTLQSKGTVQWPYPTQSLNGGTHRLFEDKKFYTSNQKAQIHSVPDENLSESISEDFPLVLTTGRIRDQWHTMTKTGKVNKLKQHIDVPFLEIHPKDAEARNIHDNDIVCIVNTRGDVRAKAKVTTEIKKGVVFLPMHWGKLLNNDFGRANNLTNKLLDPRSKEPDFKFCAVQVSKYIKPKQKIVFVGAGAACFGFVKEYRSRNSEDEIHIFSKEFWPFYNRVQLPDYLSGHQKWEQLVKMTDEEIPDFDIHVHRNVLITQILKDEKTIITENGEKHTYDVLILGMGSRAFMPKDVPIGRMQGIFNMRTRMDADNLKPYCQPNSNMLIVGGGLLGLELASSLNAIGVNITIVNRTDRVMERQLDELGSTLLFEEMRDRGIKFIFNDEVQSFIGESSLEAVKLKSGKRIDCVAAVFAIGTSPNIELAKNAGLEVKRGVVVNEYMQTSDPNIFAAGEIAEFKGMMWGITAAAEQQATIIARYLEGDLSAVYSGSTFMNILKMEDFQLCSIGIPEAPSSDPNFEEVVFIDKSKRYYKKCIINNDKLVGAILIGDKSEFIEFKDLISNKIELSDKRLELLRSNKKAEPVIGKLVCSCNSVGEGNIINKIKQGCSDFDKLCLETGAGQGCGSCRPEVKGIMQKLLVTA